MMGPYVECRDVQQQKRDGIPPRMVAGVVVRCFHASGLHGSCACMFGVAGGSRKLLGLGITPCNRRFVRPGRHTNIAFQQFSLESAAKQQTAVLAR